MGGCMMENQNQNVFIYSWLYYIGYRFVHKLNNEIWVSKSKIRNDIDILFKRYMKPINPKYDMFNKTIIDDIKNFKIKYLLNNEKVNFIL